MNEHFPTFDRLRRLLVRPLPVPRLLDRRAGNHWRIASHWTNEPTAVKQRSLLRILAIARREHLDTALLVKNLSDEHTHGYRRRLRRLAKRLADATPLVEALEQTPDVLSDETVLAIRFGSQAGTLQATFDQLLATPAIDRDAAHPVVRQSAYYLAGMMFVLIVVMIFLMFRIVPVLEQISREFSQQPPERLHELIVAWRWIIDYFWLLLAIGLVIAWLIASRTMQRFYRRIWGSRYVRSVARLRSAELLHLLAPAVDAGRPLGGALSTLARYHYDRNVRAKLLFARNEVEQGADPWSSLGAAGLLSVDESRALAASTSNGTRRWLMCRLADRRRHQAVRRMNLLLLLIQPLVVLALAAIVLWVGLAMFELLYGLAHGLA